MSLEESEGVEHLGRRCEECGATLTQQELAAVMESGGPVLCTIHAQERVELDEDEALE